MFVAQSGSPLGMIGYDSLTLDFAACRVGAVDAI
jgi:hypothetical protein